MLRPPQPEVSALYDADGNRVKRTLDQTTTFYLGETYEIDVSSPVDEDTVGVYGFNSRQFIVSNDLTPVAESFRSASYGTSGDIPLVGDWDGDGYDNAGVWRSSNHRFYFGGIPAATGSFPSANFGATNDIGIVGDWDGDGIDTIAVWRPSNGVWYFRNDHSAGPAEFTSPYGTNGDIPIVGDWDGDGIDTPGLYRNGTFFLRNDFAGGVAQITMANVGNSTDRPITGDWDGDGIDTVGFYRTTSNGGVFYLKNSNSGSGIDITTNPFGSGGSPPIAGNFNASIGHDGQQITINHNLAGVNIGSTINGEFYATAADHLGSTGVTRDEDAHTRVQRYTPYGAVRAASYNSNMPTDESFTGQTTDPGLGLIDYNARHYDPQLGRFIMADTVLDGLNRYTYVRNNPLNATDPTGNDMCRNGGGGCGGVRGVGDTWDENGDGVYSSDNQTEFVWFDQIGDSTPRPYTPRTQISGFADPVDYIADEINDNSASLTVSGSRNCDHLITCGAAIVSFGLNVVPSGEWDHKPTILNDFGAEANVDIAGTDWTIPHDLWSNFHFGVVAERMGLDIERVIAITELQVPVIVGQTNPLDSQYIRSGYEFSSQHSGTVSSGDIEAWLAGELDRFAQSDDITRPRRS